jgi:hypothetical protein
LVIIFLQIIYLEILIEVFRNFVHVFLSFVINLSFILSNMQSHYGYFD